MNKLPFLEPKGWPKLRKMSGESKYGFSEDDELIESALNELHQAIESKDHKLMLGALSALIDCILNKEPGDENAPDSLEKT
jgi:hypothetical protein